MAHTIFYSWQSDRPAKVCRNFIEDALKIAVKKISNDMTVEEAIRDLEIDKDTKNVPGSPRILDTILEKIDRAAIFVPDLTFVGTNSSSEPIPNPNVMLEYGWALKSLGERQFIPVMNKAYGEPTKTSLPFHLGNFRFPLTYNLPDSVTSEQRNQTRIELAGQFEDAIRTVLDSDGFKAKLPKPPALEAFPMQAFRDGESRFRLPNRPLGTISDSMLRMIGMPHQKHLYLAKGPALWLRLMPKYGPAHDLLRTNLAERLLATFMKLPLLRGTPDSSLNGVGLVMGEDGCGRYPAENDEVEAPITHSVVYLFTTGELWIINAWASCFPDKQVVLSESAFSVTLEQAAMFLDELGCTRPYQWIVGAEGMKDHDLWFYDPPRRERKVGTFLSNLIKKEGDFDKNSQANALLSPFFTKVFDACNAKRGQYA